MIPDRRIEPLPSAPVYGCQEKPAQEHATGRQPVTVEHLAAFSETFTDLADADVMHGAWE